MTKHTKLSLGCYADGTFGHDHIRTILAGMVDRWNGPQDLVESLQGEMPDDDSDTDEAIEFLNETACSVGVMFTMDNGDLMLIDSMGGEL